MSRTTTTVTITGKSGPQTVPAAWRGDRLAVNRPVLKSGLSTAPRTWTVTHLGTGLSAATVNAPQRAVIALAKAWDHPAAGWEALEVSADGRRWPWARRWRDDVDRASRGLPVIGPRELTPLEALESAGTAAEVEAAVRAAMGAPPPDAEADAGQWPAPITRKAAGSGAVRRAPDGLLEYYWLPRGGNYSEAEAIALTGWYEVPEASDVEDQCLGSVALTPCEDSVEPDHPDAWPRLLGLV